MALPTLAHLLQLIIILSAATSHTNAIDRSTYIVHMDKSYMPKAFPTHHHWYTSVLDSTTPKSTQNLIYVYDTALTGFSALLSEAELNSLRKYPGFVSAYADKIVTLHTTHTFEFLSLNPVAGLWPASNYGQDVIVGVIDTGVWPESRSFNDDGMTKVPKRWKGRCQGGQDFNSSLFNSKLIGVRYFNKGVMAANPNTTTTMINSARDTAGHGTHTSSTVAGNYVEGASYFGYASGTARGVAPRAWVAMYKVCTSNYEECYTSDYLSGMDRAVADGVDTMSISMGFTSFGAMEKGVFVSTGAGNDGPSLGSLYNGIPWVLTVVASSIDRSFAGTVTLGNGLTINGWTMFPASALVNDLPLIYNKTLSHCNSTGLLSNPPYDGIIICDIDTVDSLYDVETRSKATSAIFICDDPLLAEFQEFFYPGVVIGSKDAEVVIIYAKRSKKPKASIKFQQTILGTKPAPVVASYTSRGPAQSYPGILKPDLMAPGSLVLAAWPPNRLATYIGSNIDLSSDYNLHSGTSMACPHASGVAALLKGAHPEWSPAAIRSAMMTTANPLDNTLNHIRDLGLDLENASPLAMGAGQVDPNRALDPGLIYDVSPHDYVNLLCSMNLTKAQILTITRSNNYTCSSPSEDLNYPSFIVLYTNKTTMITRTFQRTVTNVGDGPRIYKAEVTAPEHSTIFVWPEKILFVKKYEKQSYNLTIKYMKEKNGTVKFGSLVWVEENGNHTVRSPIVVSPFDDDLL
ncbi:subtilisin-like protease SBT3 [Cornus florida]|uniref:subtilisin-like protease SBT3 n=1 Tax=Cornus florida TaxID=4283 RepID=UPI00289F2B45|nr:subtilisin-like protease SBT3 [Cornus florida]